MMIRKLWAALLAWLGLGPGPAQTTPPVNETPPVDDDILYHTMDEGQDAAVTRGPGYHNGERLL